MHALWIHCFPPPEFDQEVKTMVVLLLISRLETLSPFAITDLRVTLFAQGGHAAPCNAVQMSALP